MFKLQLQPLLKVLSGLSKREKIIFYAAATALSLVALDRLIIYPVYSRINSLNNAIKEGETGIVRDMRMLAQKEKIILESKKYASFFSSPESEEEATTSFLKEVENQAGKSSLYIVDMKPAGVKAEKDGTKKFQVVLSCEGQMEQVIEFMYNIENLNSLFNIEKYQISPKSKETGTVQCSITIAMIVMA
ncbi:MAG: type 4a pilus biogenesis protein PilO [Candidatus Omnitrophota bacterium]